MWQPQLPRGSPDWLPEKPNNADPLPVSSLRPKCLVAASVTLLTSNGRKLKGKALLKTYIYYTYGHGSVSQIDTRTHKHTHTQTHNYTLQPTIMATANHHRYFENFIILRVRFAQGGWIILWAFGWMLSTIQNDVNECLDEVCTALHTRVCVCMAYITPNTHTRTQTPCQLAGKQLMMAQLPQPPP